MASSTVRKPLTHARQAETAKAEDKPYHLNAGEGLFLEVTPDGAKRWRFRYTFGGKRKLLSMGVFPAVGLSEAKDARDAARRLVAQEVDPSERRQDHKLSKKLSQANSFATIAVEWMGRQTDRSESTRRKNEWLLQFAINSFGYKPISQITPPMVLEVCRKLEAEDKLDTAQRIRIKCSQVFRYAVATSRLERDPTTDLRGAIKSPAVTHRAAITDPKALGKLLRDIYSYEGYFTTQCALKLAPLFFIRPGELRAALWADIDLDAGLWCYTPPKTRNKTQLAHIVPLCTQAVTILRGLHAFTSSSVYVFPNLRNMRDCMSENTINGALRRMNYSSDQMCGHGFRATARTILEEVLGFSIELIEQQLAHMVKDVHGRAYNRTKHLPERTRMMQVWADYLETLREGADVLPFKTPT